MTALLIGYARVSAVEESLGPDVDDLFLVGGGGAELIECGGGDHQGRLDGFAVAFQDIRSRGAAGHVD
jgi:hypothetical protein